MIVSVILLLGASVSGNRELHGLLDSSSSPTSFPVDKEGFSARFKSSRKLLYRTQYGVCHRDSSRPSCEPFFNVTCEKGGSLGCWSCEMIQMCTPEAVGCYFHSMDNITYCGF
ncbi:uncharacterized protein LOC9634807 [Selaginella moellendorffii]|nr:uncharacterized protein LOC9634807 [Selaginella moellendorffii]|eukprot:XP_024540398.1 uncharacterized protein LOC9634807 [Selaginella moellendorffii]